MDNDQQLENEAYKSIAFNYSWNVEEGNILFLCIYDIHDILLLTVLTVYDNENCKFCAVQPIIL